MPWRTVVPDPGTVQALDRMFPRQARFYTDENVDLRVAEILRELGLDVKTAVEVKLTGRDDTDHFAYAHREDRILLSHDRDFLDDRSFPPHRCPGVVVIDIDAPNRDTVESVIWLLKTVVAPYGGLWKHAKILILRDFQMTVWMREHSSGKRTKRRYRLSGRTTEEWVD